MTVMYDFCHQFNSAVCFSGKNNECGRIVDNNETIHNLLMDCKFHVNKKATAYNQVIINGANKVVDKTEALQENWQPIILILNSYISHLQ